MADEPVRLTLTVPEAARVLGIGRNACYERIHEGTLPAIRLGRRLVVPKAGLERLLSGAGSHKGEG